MNEISTPTSTSPTSTTRDPITATMYRAALRTMPTGDVYTGDNLTLTYGDAFADHIEETARIMGDLASLTGRDATPTHPPTHCQGASAVPRALAWPWYGVRTMGRGHPSQTPTFTRSTCASCATTSGCGTTLPRTDHRRACVGLHRAG